MPVPRKTPSSQSTIQRNVSRVARILMAVKGMEQRDLASAMGMDPSAVTRALRNQRKWTLEEVERLGEVFDCEPALFLESADDLVKAQIRSRCEPQEPPGAFAFADAA